MEFKIPDWAETHATKDVTENIENTGEVYDVIIVLGEAALG